ncbi:hypothetical protein TNCV_4370241 [Trichonephila clavipes]|nr:hypothetical protein TNCV_4370241 [Trichonephila clavipes]
MRQARHLPQRWYWSIVLQVRDVIRQFTQGTPNCNTNPKATVFGIPKEPVLESAELITSRLTGAGSLLPPVYGEAWAKGHATGTPDFFPRYGSPHTANMRWVLCGDSGLPYSPESESGPVGGKEGKGNLMEVGKWAEEFREGRRRIPFDFQRTSLAGLALESATSSGLGRAPALQCRTPSRHHLELQDRRDYTPADRAARTCWLGCPGSCTIWRPETQNSAFLLYPLHGRFLQDPTSLVQRSSKVQNPAQVPVFPGSSPLCHHTKK